ncbi:MAG: hypothetical protein JSV70_02545 [bacterium]|nr:MAG: hypothetical protein JSV70_02545 [bacterium]
MTWFLYVAAVLFIAKGSFLVLHTDKAVEYGEMILEKGSHRIWGLAAALFGILLAVASFWSGVVWFLLLLGILIGGMGLFLFLGEEEKVRPLLRTWTSLSGTGLRLWGLILVVTGTAILSWI